MGFWSAFGSYPGRMHRAIYLYDNEGTPGEDAEHHFDYEQPSATERVRRVKRKPARDRCTIEGCSSTVKPGYSYCYLHALKKNRIGNAS